MNRKSSPVSSQAIHSVIGVAIMFLFPHLPIPLPHVTPVGMEILGIFIGTSVSVDHGRSSMVQSAFPSLWWNFQLCTNGTGAPERFWFSCCCSDVFLNDCHELSGT